MPKTARLLLIGLGIAAFIVLYWIAAQEQSAHQNRSRLAHDQSAEIHFAGRIAKYGFSYTAPRNRMPLYPWFQALANRRGLSDEQFFVAGKQANVILSIALLAGIFTIFRTYFPWHLSINGLAVTAFGVFALKAPYLQAELLYYALTLCYFLLMLRLLRRPALLPSLALGVVLAVAHLTKASTLPAILLFAVCYAIKLIRPQWFAFAGGPPRGPRLARCALYGLLAVCTFLAVISPYLMTSKKIYGRYFYNVNSTFYMWCDSWTEAKHFSDLYDDRHTYPDIPAAEMPSAANYVKTHSPGKILGRLFRGFGRMFTETFRSVWYMPILLLYAAGAAFAARRSWPLFRQAIRRDPVTPTFIVLFFGGYVALYSWWMILARSQRFVLTLFLPLLFTLSYIFNAFADGAFLRIRGRSIALRPAFDWSISALAVVNVILVLAWAAKAVNGGSTM